ncbi:MAG: cupredoxin domain-containing protein [Candidatus Methylomirabilaceae bacterium]
MHRRVERMDRKWSLQPAMMLVVVALVAGCASRQGTVPEPTHGTEPAPVTIVLREFEFEPRPLKVKAGRVRFLLINRGSVEHDFMIPEVMQAMQHEKDLVQPGKSKTIEVDLKPGRYQVVCTVPGHREAGMTLTLEVTS